MDLLGDKLKKLRKQKGLTQLQVANIVGVSKSIISCYEMSERNPSYEILIKLAKPYNVSTDYLLGLDKMTIDVTGLTEKQINTLMTIIDTFKRP